MDLFRSDVDPHTRRFDAIWQLRVGSASGDAQVRLPRRPESRRLVRRASLHAQVPSPPATAGQAVRLAARRRSPTRRRRLGAPVPPVATILRL